MKLITLWLTKLITFFCQESYHILNDKTHRLSHCDEKNITPFSHEILSHFDQQNLSHCDNITNLPHFPPSHH